MADPRRSGRTGALAAAAVQATGIMAGALSSLVIARKLGAHGTGIYAVAAQFLLSMMMVGGLGLRTGIAYELSAGRLSARAAATEATAMSVFFGALAGVIGFGLYLLGSDSVFEGISEPVAIVLSSAVPFAVIWWVLGAIPLAQEDYEAFAVLQSGAFVLIAVLVVPLTLAVGIDGALIALASGFVISGLATAVWVLRRAAGRARSGWELAESLRVGLRGWVLEMLQFPTLRPDIVIVAAYGTTTDAGVYSLAVTITTIGWILPQALGTVALPRVAALVATDSAEPETDHPAAVTAPVAHRALRHGVLLAVAAGVLVAGLLLIAPVIFGDGFDRTVDLGMIMLPGVIALALGRVMIALLLGLARANAVLAIGATVVPAALAAYLLAVPSGGATAAAIVSCAAYLLTTLGAALALARAGLPLGRSSLPRRSDLAEYVDAVRTRGWA